MKHDHSLSLTRHAAFRAPLFARLTRLAGLWSARRSQRQALMRLDDHLLRDIGLDPRNARDEALKHFWLE